MMESILHISSHLMQAEYTNIQINKIIKWIYGDRCEVLFTELQNLVERPILTYIIVTHFIKLNHLKYHCNLIILSKY
jgi:hypothetical protein